MELNTETFELPDIGDLQAILCERSLADFVRISWPVLHPSERFADNWHVDAICEHFEAVFNGQIENLLVNVAPRTSKSTIAAIAFPAWVWGPRNEPSTSFMYVSFSIALASDHSVKCRRLIESDWFRKYWGYRFSLTSDENQKLKFANNRQGVRAAFGAAGATGQGADLVIVDDPHDVASWLSPNQMRTVIDTFDSAIYNRVNDPLHAKRIVIGQRISDLDLSGHLLKQKNWDYLFLPSEYNPRRSVVTSIGWKDLRTKPGELLCPERYSREQIDTEKKLRPRIYQAQHQQDPTTDETAIFKRDRWRYYAEDPKEVVKRMQTVILSVDAAFKDKASSSKVAIQVWGKIGANKLLLDRDTDHMDFVNTCERLVLMANRWPEARAKVIEAKANGAAIINVLRNEVAGLVEWPPEGMKMDSKEARAYAIQPELFAGNLYLPNKESTSWTEEFIEICASFPNGEYDDDVDALSQAVMYLDRVPSAGAVPTGVGQSFQWLR